MPKKLEIEEVKSKLSDITKTIIIKDVEYHGNKIPMKCECLVCGYNFPAKWNNLSSNESGCPNCNYLSKFVTEAQIINYVESQEYKFVGVKNLLDNHTKVRITVICKDNHAYETGWTGFSSGRRCKKCQREVSNKKTKNDLNQIKNEIYEAGFEIVEPFNYKNNKTKFKLVCSEGHPWVGHYNHFSTQKFCTECKNGHPSRYTYGFVYNYFKERNCELISPEYMDSKISLEFKCSCGNTDFSSFTNFKKSLGGCSKCSEYKRQYNIEMIKEMFEEASYIVLTEVYDPYLKIDFICNNGHENDIKLSDFIYGRRCSICYYEKNRGENHYSWNPNLTDMEREKNRKFYEYQQWRKSVFDRDNYTCQCCGDSKGANLNAHHLDSYHWCKEKRIEVRNGVTLCENCHVLDENSFHKTFGFKDNTKEQFIEWLKIRRDINAIDTESAS